MAFPKPSRASLSLAAPLLVGALLAPVLPAAGARAQQQGYGQTMGTGQQEREINFDGGPSRSGSILDSANPIDLMNRIRRGTAMDDATPPGDAIDAALRDFHQQSTATQPGGAGSSLVKPAQ